MAGMLPLDHYLARKGEPLGTSNWIMIDQERIDRFADVTGDHQFIHVNPGLAAQTAFGTTIAHGYLTLSLLSRMAYDVLPGIEGTTMGVNYGLNSLRFLAPVKAGKRVRGHFTMADAVERSAGVVQTTISVSVEIEDEPKPALAAEWVTLAYLAAPAA